MKKIFTFAAAILASVAMMAVDPNYESYDWGADDFATVIADHDGIILSTSLTAWGGNLGGGVQYLNMGGGTDLSAEAPSPYFAVSSSVIIDSVEVYWAPNGGDASNLAWAGWKDEANLLAQDVDYLDQTAEYTGSKSVEGATWQMIDLTEKEVKAIMIARQIKKAKINGAQQSNIGKNKTVNIIGVRVWIGGAIAPVTDPVASVVIAGPDACFVGQAAAYTATTDVKATEYKWFVNDAEQEGATAKNFSYTPEAEGTFNIVCKAKNENNSDFVASAAIALVASARPVLEQVDVTGATTWDWNDAATVNEIKFTASSTPAKNERCLLANVEGMNNNEAFNSQALLFEGEYAMRIQSGMKLAQGQLLQFRTTVAGYVTVEYSNTGGRSAAEGETEGQESERRFITVNGNLVAGDAGSMVATSKTIVQDVPVEAGDVAISALRPYWSGHETDVQYVRFYKIQFSLTPTPTAIENAEEAVKAVKFFENGQLMIEKNGVIYNAQGAIVK